jgi:hypothetical protein
MPPEMADYPTEVREAFDLHRLLADRWDGMSGYYMGKDLSSLGSLISIYEIEDPKICVYFLKHIDHAYANMVNAKVKAEHEARKRKMKSK